MYRSKVYGYEMTLISEVYLSTLSALMKPHGLEQYFVAILFLNEQAGHITQKDLGTVLRRDKVFTMRLVDALSTKGFVERHQDYNDRRCQLLELTEKGKALVPMIEQAVEQTNELLFKGFTAEERTVFECGMTQMMKLLDSQPKPSFTVTASEHTNDE
ncbi:MAG: MarR family transcriptional regulator [Flavobacteriales bacterium]|nr:MarR family transcriptional regulator [Flavobacteriales bacterium]